MKQVMTINEITDFITNKEYVYDNICDTRPFIHEGNDIKRLPVVHMNSYLRKSTLGKIVKNRITDILTKELYTGDKIYFPNEHGDIREINTIITFLGHDTWEVIEEKMKWCITPLELEPAKI